MTPTASSRRRMATLTLGVAFIVIATVMPYGWYDALPTNPAVPPPEFSGVSLFRWVLALQGVLLAWLGWRGVTYSRIAQSERLPVALPQDSDHDLSVHWTLWLLSGITLLALVLRSWALGADFWVDEVRATLDAREMSTLAVFGSYVRSNVHMLNTLLMKASFAAFGEAEWSARLPAVLFGTASIPALYWVCRLVAVRWVSLSAALLLAVSYHHVFFSQNARGYVLYVFFSLISSGLLVHALRDDGPGHWALYVVTTVLNFASILISGFVFAAHILVGAAALVVVRVRGRPLLPLLRRLVVVFGITTLLGFQLYSVQLPQVISYIGVTYASPATGYTLLSVEFIGELVRGLSVGFGPGLLLGAVPFMLLAGAGYAVFVRRQWTLAAGLTLPLVLTAALLILRGLTVSPRFFLLGLPVAALTAVLTVDLSARSLAGWRGWGTRSMALVTGAVVILLASASLASLGGYYAVPKQSYRASLAHAADVRQSGEVVIAIQTARRGGAYYGPEFGLVQGQNLFLADSLEELEEALAGLGPDHAVLLTSMPRAMQLERPDLKARIEAAWEISATFPATVGDGQISVWTPVER